MLNFLGDALGAIVSGGATGLIGAGLTMFKEIKAQKMAFAHDERMTELEHQGMQLEAELKMSIVKAESEAAIQIQESKAFADSYKHDTRAYATGKLGKFGQTLMVIVDFCRGMIRPSMTIYMTVLTTWLYIDVMDMAGGLDGVITKDQAMSMMMQIILVILYITTTVILWWFGTRSARHASK